MRCGEEQEEEEASAAAAARPWGGEKCLKRRTGADASDKQRHSAALIMEISLWSAALQIIPKKFREKRQSRQINF